MKEIDDIIAAQETWKKTALTQLRAIIRQAEPSLVEEIKWKTRSRPAGLPVWSHSGIVCMAEIWKDNIKLIFPKGVHLSDPKKLFNSRLQSQTDRALELREGDSINEAALTALVREATNFNASKA
ncbi:MAG: DUF1801 domain-containing protein [Candidatus Saccharibacteria bacterium]|nr:MAG: DUF1801 domain-containing protein [Candidatus Saccharibacteria bacterium]